MTTVSGELTFTSANGDGPELLGKLAAFVEDLKLSGIGMGVEVRLRPQGDLGLAAPLLGLINAQGERVMASGQARIAASAHTNGAAPAAVPTLDGVPRHVDPTPAAPARDPDEPQSTWDLRPTIERKQDQAERRMEWDWSLLADPELRPTIVALDLGRTTWRQVTKTARHTILEFFAAHLVAEKGSTRVPYKRWDERRPAWMPVATGAPVAYRMPWAVLMQNASRCVPGLATSSGA